MSEKDQPISIKLRGLYSPVAVGNNLYRIDVGQFTRRMNLREVPEMREETSSMLREWYADVPEAHLNWAEKLFKTGARQEALDFVCFAIEKFRYDRTPEIILFRAIKLLRRNDLDDYADIIEDRAVKHFPENQIFATERAKRLHKNGSTTEAIEFLEEKVRCECADLYEITFLGRLYYLAGRSDDAVRVFEQVERDHDVDFVFYQQLAVAYADMLNISGFERIQEHLNEKSRAFLLAKIFYLKGDSQKAQKALNSQLQEESKPPVEMVGLYLACVTNGHPLHDVILTRYGHEYHGEVLRVRDQWHRDPRHVVIEELRFSTSLELYELGGNPASVADRQKAGLGVEVRVAVAAPH